MAVEEEKLAEAVRKNTVLYDKSDKFFEDRNKNYWHGWMLPVTYPEAF